MLVFSEKARAQHGGEGAIEVGAAANLDTDYCHASTITTLAEMKLAACDSVCGRRSQPRRRRAKAPRRVLNRLFQTIPNFIQPGPGSVVIQFSSRGATCADRSNRLIPELDHNSTAKEHDVRQLR